MKTLFEYLFGAAVVAGVILLAVMLFFVVTAPTYADGYCKALGGTRIGQSVCNVDGRVVEVK